MNRVLKPGEQVFLSLEELVSDENKRGRIKVEVISEATLPEIRLQIHPYWYSYEVMFVETKEIRRVVSCFLSER